MVPSFLAKQANRDARRCRCGAQFCYSCGERWKSCACPLWDEPRLLRRANQIVDRAAAAPPLPPPPAPIDLNNIDDVEPQPEDNIQEPEDLQHIAAAPDTPQRLRGRLINRIAAGPADNDDDGNVAGVASPRAGSPNPAVAAEQNLRTRSPSPFSGVARAETGARADLVARMMQDLLENHECEHRRWNYIGGRHQCEECFHTLPLYIFECRQCRLRACWRCRRHRL